MKKTVLFLGVLGVLWFNLGFAQTSGEGTPPAVSQVIRITPLGALRGVGGQPAYPPLLNPAFVINTNVDALIMQLNAQAITILGLTGRLASAEGDLTTLRTRLATAEGFQTRLSTTDNLAECNGGAGRIMIAADGTQSCSTSPVPSPSPAAASPSPSPIPSPSPVPSPSPTGICPPGKAYDPSGNMCVNGCMVSYTANTSGCNANTRPASCIPGAPSTNGYYSGGWIVAYGTYVDMKCQLDSFGNCNWSYAGCSSGQRQAFQCDASGFLAPQCH